MYFWSAVTCHRFKLLCAQISKSMALSSRSTKSGDKAPHSKESRKYQSKNLEGQRMFRNAFNSTSHFELGAQVY